MSGKQYNHQILSLKNIKGEKWKDIPGLEQYYMVSNFGRVKRLEYEMKYRNGAIYVKEEKIIKPWIQKAKNKFKNDVTCFLINRVKLDGIRHNLTISRLVYNCFVASFDLDNSNILILCKDGDGLNIHPGNLKMATRTEKARRIVERGRMESNLKYLSKSLKKKIRKKIVATLSKQVSQYSMNGKKIKTFPSAAAAERSTGIFATSIGQSATGNKISAGGFIWRWGIEKTVDINEIRKQRKAAHRAKFGQKVTQYDLQGNKIAQFNSLQEAEAASGANGNAIRLVLKAVYKSAKGYYWVKGFGRDKIDLSNYKWGKGAMAATQSKKVRQLTQKDKLIKVFPSIKEAAKEINVTASVIVDVCRGRQKSSGGYKWEYAK